MNSWDGEQYTAGEVLKRAFQCAIDHWNPMDGREDIHILQLVGNRLVEDTSKIPMVVAQSIPVLNEEELKGNIVTNKKVGDKMERC